MRYLHLVTAASAPLTMRLVQAINSVSPSTIQGSIKANSSIGKKLLSQTTTHERTPFSSSRSLEGNVDFSYVADYSIKFQGCHHVNQVSSGGDDGGGAVTVYIQRLVRFRLCPSDTCVDDDDDTSGCSSDYGEYVVDLNAFTEGWLQDMANNGNGNNNADGFDPVDYAQCVQYDDNYYIGPYCSEDGDGIRLGIFSDYNCQTQSSDGASDFYDANGYELPYSDDDDLISNACLSCYDGNNDDGDDDDNVREVCYNVYGMSAKCEAEMNVKYPYEDDCSYIAAIREEGSSSSSGSGGKKLVITLVVLVVGFVILLGAVFYMKKRLESKPKIELSSGGGGDALT